MKVTVLATLTLLCLSETKTDTSLRDLIINLEPYTQGKQQSVLVKLNGMQVDTFFKFFDYNAGINLNTPRNVLKLNNKPFTVIINVQYANARKVDIKVFLAPKYNSDGFPISLDDNLMNFDELDLFEYNLTGQNTIVRRSDEFFYKQGEVLTQLYKFLEDTPDISSGIPFQFIVLVYPSTK